MIELDKDYRQLQEAKTKIEAHFETLVDQVKQQETERQTLMGAVPKLQEAIVLIERCNRGTECFGMHQTLKRIGSLMNDQIKRDKIPTVMRRRNIRIPPAEASRDSILSMFSDTSSVADSCVAEEETNIRSSGNAKNDETTVTVQTSNSDLKTKTNSEAISKFAPLVTGGYKPKTSDQKTVGSIQVDAVTQTSTETNTNATTEPNLVSTLVKSQDAIKSTKEMSHGHVRQQSSDLSTKQRSSTHPRKATRHYSVSEISTKHGRSQSFKDGDRFREIVSSQQSQSYLVQVGDELQLKLEKQRKKLDLQSSMQ